MRFSLVLFASLGMIACDPPPATFDGGSEDDAGSMPQDAGSTTDAGVRACRGAGACASLNENQCTTVADAGCAVRRTGRCLDRGTCTGSSMSTCLAGGACTWNGSACARAACGAQPDEMACTALSCGWGLLFAGCDGATYDCARGAEQLSPSSPEQACGALTALGLACMP